VCLLKFLKHDSYVVMCLKIIDVANPQRIQKEPDNTIILLQGSFAEQGFTINKIELRLFVEKQDEKLGPYSLITVLVSTDKGEVESLYDEGYRGENSLQNAANLILGNLGLSAIILRSIITLNSINSQNGDPVR
jgi:hypothetical protein